MDMKPMLDAGEVEQLIMRGFEATTPFFRIDSLEPGRAKVHMPFKSWMRRPGNVISGPALFTAADLAMYALVLSHLGPVMMAVTSNLNLNFLNKGEAGDVHAEAEMLKLGRKLAVMDIKLRCVENPVLVAHATGAYSIPSARPAA